MTEEKKRKKEKEKEKEKKRKAMTHESYANKFLFNLGEKVLGI